MNYIFPNNPLWIPIETVNDYKKDFIAEFKKNGWRCDTYMTEEGLTLWTKRKTIIKDLLPITRSKLSLLPVGTVIDGELIDKRTKDTKDYYYAFDILYHQGESVMHLPWKERRELLEKVVDPLGVEISEPIALGFSNMYKIALEQGDEGIVLKNIN